MNVRENQDGETNTGNRFYDSRKTILRNTSRYASATQISLSMKPLCAKS